MKPQALFTVPTADSSRSDTACLMTSLKFAVVAVHVCLRELPSRIPPLSCTVPLVLDAKTCKSFRSLCSGTGRLYGRARDERR